MITRLEHEPPSWVREYVGLEFADRGRDRTGGVDCWGLLRLVYLERLGVVLPSYVDAYVGIDDAAGVSSVAAMELSHWTPLPDGPERVGDVGLFRIDGRRWHVGVAVSRTKMLHAIEGAQTCVETLPSPLWTPRLSSWYRYAGPVNIRHRSHPLRDDVRNLRLPAGDTIEAMRIAADVPDVEGLEATLSGSVVPRDAWALVRPKPGTVLAFAVTPRGGGGGGGKTIARVVLTIAIVAAAVYTGGAAAGALELGVGTAGFAVTSGVVTAATTIAGTLLVNALIPVPGQRLTDNAGRSASSSISGARNEARTFGVVNTVLGTHRLSPPYAALPYTELVGDDQYLRLLFDVGYGPLALSDLKIGETPITQFEGVEVELREGEETDAPLSLYPGVVLEQSVQVRLLAVEDWTVRTSAEEADELSVDVTLPQGLAGVGADGGRNEREVQFAVQYRPVGTTDWLEVNGAPPETERQMQMLFRTPEVEPGGEGVYTGPVQWAADGSIGGPKPDDLPASMYSWEVQGYLQFDEAGEYEFAVDGAGAVELQVGGRVVASWYGDHAAAGSGGVPSFGSHTGTIYLRRGRVIRGQGGSVRFRLRLASRGPGAVAVGWKPPGATTFAVIPAERLRVDASATAAQGLRSRWFDTSGYRGVLAIVDSATTPLRRTVVWAVPRGQYDVRLQRITPDADAASSVVDSLYWSALRTIRNTAPVKLPGRALIALRIKATDQLSGVVDTFNCVATSILPDWDATEGRWIERATNNPAACFRALLQGPGNKRPLPDSRLDLPELQAWSEACDVTGLRCNAVIDFAGTVYERLRDVASSGRASLNMRNGLFSVVRDRAQTTPAQVFTPRNSRNLRGSLVFPDQPHALRVGFLDSSVGYQRNEVLVCADGYSPNGEVPGTEVPTRIEAIELYGVTSWAEVWKHGRFYLASAKLRPEVFELEVDVDNLVCGRGDLVLVSHDVPLLGTGYGRIAALGVDTDGQLSTLGLDAAVAMDEGFRYRVRVRLATGVILTLNVRAEIAPETNTLQLDPPLAPGTAWPAVGDLFAFGLEGREVRECVVKAILPGPDLTARLLLVDHAPAIHLADVGPIPEFDPGITRAPEFERGPAAPEVLTIQSDDYVMARAADGSLTPRMLLTYRVVGRAEEPAVFVQVRTRRMPSGGATPSGPFVMHPATPVGSGAVYIDGVEEGVRYQIRIRTVGQTGRASRWVDTWVPTPPDPDANGEVQPLEHTVIGKSLPPPDVQLFDVTRMADGTRRYTWDLGTIPPDVVGVEIRYLPFAESSGVRFEDFDRLHTGTLEGASPWESEQPPAGVWTFGIKMVDSSGNLSRSAVFVNRTLGPGPQDGVVASADAVAERWPGTIEGAYVAIDGTLWADSRVPWSDLPARWDDWTHWTLSPVSPVVYTHTVLDLGAELDVEAGATVAGTGTFVVEVASSSDGFTWNAWQTVDAVAQRAVRGRYFKFRLTATNNPPDPVHVTAFVMTLRGETVEQFLDNVQTASLGAAYRNGVGDVRIPISSGLFSVIRGVSVSFNGMGAGWSWELVDRLISPGPRVRLYNASDVPADAVVDVTVRGLRAATPDPLSLLLLAPTGPVPDGDLEDSIALW